MKKTKLFFGVLMIASSSIFGQSLPEAIKQTTNEQFETADATFQKLIQAQPNNGEIYFYYGENFFKNGNTDMAGKMYQKGVDVNATNPLPYVGLGKAQWYQNKATEAKANFYKATTLAAGKNATVLMKIAEAYTNADTKDLPTAFTLLAQAAKLEPKNPDVYVLTGDAFLEQNNGSEAIKNYEAAENLDKKSTIAILREGQLYSRAKNYTLALDLYKKAISIDSTYAPAYQEMGDIYIRAGQFENAVAKYKRYLQINNDCSARGFYAGALNQAKHFPESIDAAKEALKCNPNNDYLYRYLAYDYYDSPKPDYAAGLESSNTFFSKLSPDIKVIPQDYEYHAKLLSKTGKDSLAILDYIKALELQPDKIEFNSDIAAAYLKMKKYPEAISYYGKKIAGNKANANDYYGLGRAYFYSKDFQNADSSFLHLITLQPDLPLGYLWRAQSNSQLDPKNEKWAAKTFYETYLSKLKPEDLTQAQNKSNLINAYNYLAAYYASLKDCPNLKIYMQKVLSIDPENAQAKKVLAGLKC